MLKRSAAVAIALAWMPVALPQTPAPATSPNPTINTGTSLVLVPTLVRTRLGELVFTLTADDFVVTDDGVEQKVTLDQDSDDQPMALAVVVETGSAGARMLDNYRYLGPMIDALPGNVSHVTAVITFDSVPKLAQDFTPDPDAVGDTLNSLRPGNDQDAILDSLRFAVDLLSKQPPTYRRAILLISETIDHGSRESLELALQAISDTNTSIYSLAFSSTRGETKHGLSSAVSSDTPGPAGGCLSKDTKPAPDSGSDADSGAGSNGTSGATSAGGNGQSRLAQAYDCLSLLLPPLRVAKVATIAAMNRLERNVPETVTELTGGEFYKFEKAKALQAGLSTISNHIPNRYELSFQPQSPHPGLHTIEVRLKDYPNLVVTARHDYWADSPTR